MVDRDDDQELWSVLIGPIKIEAWKIERIRAELADGSKIEACGKLKEFVTNLLMDQHKECGKLRKLVMTSLMDQM